MRHGFLGGTFDPVHMGHLDVARAARTALSLDEIRFIPSNVPPHRTPPKASAADRFAMVELAVRDEPGMLASDVELQDDGPSYTSATLDRLAAEGLDSHTLFFITGADAFRDLPMWKDYPRLLDRCHFVAVSRPGSPAGGLRAALPELAPRMVEAPLDLAANPRIVLVDAVTADVSSTGIRQRIADGVSVDGLVPAGVAEYIRVRGLYRGFSSDERI